MSSLLGDILGVGGGAGLVGLAYNRLGNVGDQAFDRASQIANTSSNMAQFQPYGVTSAGGGRVNADATGSLNVSLSPQEDQLRQLLQGGAMSMFGQAMGPTAGREADVYERIRALQRPGEQRQDLALESRLYNQGRGGVQTSMFGGTPEQFAINMAREEARNQAALNALTFAGTEQQQRAQLGTNFLSSSYAPEASLMNLFGQGTNVAGLADVARRQQAGLYGEGMMSGVNAQLGASLGQANLAGALGSGLLSGAFGGSLSGLQGGIQSGWAGLQGLLGNIFGGGGSSGGSSGGGGPSGGGGFY